jgi:hypothetical protein
MKIKDDVRKFAGEQGISEETALQRGMQGKRREFAAERNEIYAKA